MIGWIKRKSNNRLVHTNSGLDPDNQKHIDSLLKTARSTMSDAEFTFGFDNDSVVKGWLQAQVTADENTWENRMLRSDSVLPRWGEDILDGMDKSGVAQITLDKLQAKKDLRAKMP